jgi:hypothetical protein
MLRPLSDVVELGVARIVVVGETVRVGVALAGPARRTIPANDVAVTARAMGTRPLRRARRHADVPKRGIRLPEIVFTI